MSETRISDATTPNRNRKRCNPGNGRTCPNLAQRSCRGMCKKHYRYWVAQHPPVDTEIVAAHIDRLRAAGIGWRRMSMASGVSISTLRRMRRDNRRYCFGVTAEAILALTPDDFPELRINPVGVIRRMQSLVALGYTEAVLEAEIRTGHMWQYLGGGNPPLKWVTPDVHARVDKAFRKLAARPAPTGWTADRARRRAAARGWLPPLAWDEETIDDPAAQPIVEAIRKPERRNGRDTVRADFVEEYLELRDVLRLNDEAIADRMGINYETLVARLRRRNITPQGWGTGRHEVAS